MVVGSVATVLIVAMLTIAFCVWVCKRQANCTSKHHHGGTSYACSSHNLPAPSHCSEPHHFSPNTELHLLHSHPTVPQSDIVVGCHRSRVGVLQNRHPASEPQATQWDSGCVSTWNCSSCGKYKTVNDYVRQQSLERQRTMHKNAARTATGIATDYCCCEHPHKSVSETESNSAHDPLLVKVPCSSCRAAVGVAPSEGSCVETAL